MQEKIGPQFYLVDLEEDLNKPINNLTEHEAQLNLNSHLFDKYRPKQTNSVKIIELDNNESIDGAMEI